MRAIATALRHPRAVFARLILALLMAAFALPALANGPCHDAPAPRMAAAMHHGVPGKPVQDDRPTAPHVCIGCIPPASLAKRLLAAPVAATVLPSRIVASAFMPGTGTPPALAPSAYSGVIRRACCARCHLPVR